MTDLPDFASAVAAAADLDDGWRRQVDQDLYFADYDLAILDAVTASRSPLPTDLLTQVRDDVIPNATFIPGDRKRLADAVTDQLSR